MSTCFLEGLMLLWVRDVKGPAHDLPMDLMTDDGTKEVDHFLMELLRKPESYLPPSFRIGEIIPLSAGKIAYHQCRTGIRPALTVTLKSGPRR